MVTDPLFFQLFQTVPDTFFMMLGLSPAEAAAKAKAYVFRAVEVKEAAHRLDGAFIPNDPAEPIYFLESLFYRYGPVYADIMTKAFSFHKRNDPEQPFKAVVLFARRTMAPQITGVYAVLQTAGYLEIHYLNELPEPPNSPLSLSILKLIGKSKGRAPEVARTLIARTEAEIADETTRANLVQFIETVIISKLPKLTREEIQKMLGVRDIRKTRVYQDAKKEGVEEGIEKGRVEGRVEGLEKGRRESLEVKLRLVCELAPDRTASQIAKLLSLDIKLVREELAKMKP